MWKEEVLEGKTITEVRIKGETVWLKHVDGWIEIEIAGDCCSSAFIDAVRFSGSPTLTGETQEISFAAKPTEQEVDEVTAMTLVSVSNRGCVSILHRNSSNGYYGNYLSYKSHGTPPDDSELVKTDWYRKT